MNTNNEKVTSFSDLKNYARGAKVKFPPFAEGQPLVAMIKRPSVVTMISEGKFPNELMDIAVSLFMDGSVNKNNVAKTMSNKDLMKNLFEVVNVIADESFIEPTIKEITDAGMVLTDDQKLFLFDYVQSGVKALKPFREEQKDTGHNSNVTNVPKDAVRTSKHRR